MGCTDGDDCVYEASMRVLCAILLLASVSVAYAELQPARITITTDGTTSTVEVSGGDVGYPGPSQVTIERDALGLVVVSRVRVFEARPWRTYLPVVHQ